MLSPCTMRSSIPNAAAPDPLDSAFDARANTRQRAIRRQWHGARRQHLDSQPEQAIQLYKQALAMRPDWPEGWLYMGGALYQAARYAEATDALRKGLALAPVFANGWALLGP